MSSNILVSSNIYRPIMDGYTLPLSEDTWAELRYRARLHRHHGHSVQDAAHLAVRYYRADGFTRLVDMGAGASEYMQRLSYKARTWRR